MSVVAVVQPGRSAPAGAGEVVRAPRLREGVVAAMATDADWLWLVDPRTEPAWDALDRLLAPLGDLGRVPAPILLASKVVGADGQPHPDALPNPEMFEKHVTVAAVTRRLLQVRAVRPGSVLVARRAVERFGPPRGELGPVYDLLEWSARMLRDWDDVGFLVPASVARRDAPPTGASGRLRDRATALLRGPGWSPTEKLWNAYTMVVGPVRDDRAPARRA